MTRISDLTAVTTLDGSETLPVVQSGSTKKATAAEIAAAAFDLAVGQYTAAFATTTTTNTGPEGFIQGSPVLLPACTLDRIGVDVTTAGGAGALYRLGIYDKDLALVLDAGTVDTTTTGVKEITISQALTGGVYWLVGVQQGAAASNTTVRQNSGAVFGCPSSNTAGISGNTFAGWTLATAVTGALPSTGSYTAVSTRVVRAFVRVA